jgi:hypothetical protein
MFMYFLLFTIIGAGVGKFIEEPKTALIVIVVIATLWGLSSQMIWGLVSLGELFLGYFLVRHLSK